MKVENWDIDKVTPYPHNPRDNDDAVPYVANSIKEFGWQQPIVVDKDGVVIAGHTRLKAAKELGLDEVPVIVADGLSPEQVKAFRLADNKSGELADWDISLLDDELNDIFDINMEDFGFENGDKYKGDLDDIFFESEEQASKDSAEYLKWGTSKVWLSEDGSRLLDDLYKKYKTAVTNEEIEFVQWLLNREGDFDEVDVS